MDAPTTAEAAASVLVALATVGDNPTAPGGDPGGDPWFELTDRRLTPELAARWHRSREVAWRNAGVDPQAAPVVVTLPLDLLAHAWAWGIDAEDPPAPGAVVATTRLTRPGRPRLVLVNGPAAPATPRGSYALTVATIGARMAADQLVAWAEPFKTSDKRTATTEADQYREFAAAAEAQIADSFAWASDLEVTPAQAFPTVPAVMRATAQLGTD